MRFTTFILTGLLVAGIVVGVRGEEAAKIDVKKLAGYVDFDVGKILGDVKPAIEVSIPPSLLPMVSAATKHDEPELSDLLSKLSLIRVQLFEDIGARGAEKIKERVAEITTQLKKDGWENVVRAQDEGDSIDMLVRAKDGSIAGLAMFLVSSDGEAIFVNIVGEFDPALLGQLGGAFGMPQMPVLNMVPGEGAEEEKEEASPLPKMEEQSEASVKEREAAPSEGSEP